MNCIYTGETKATYVEKMQRIPQYIAVYMKEDFYPLTSLDRIDLTYCMFIDHSKQFPSGQVTFLWHILSFWKMVLQTHLKEVHQSKWLNHLVYQTNRHTHTHTHQLVNSLIGKTKVNKKENIRLSWHSTTWHIYYKTCAGVDLRYSVFCYKMFTWK